MTKHRTKSSKTKLPRSHSKVRHTKSKRSHSKANIFGCKSRTKQGRQKHPKAKQAMKNPKANQKKTHGKPKSPGPVQKSKSRLDRTKSRGSHLSPNKSRGHMGRTKSNGNYSVRKSASGIGHTGKSQSNMKTKSASSNPYPVIDPSNGEKVEVFDGMKHTDEQGFDYVYLWKYDDEGPGADPAFVPSPQEIQEKHGVMPQTSLTAPDDCNHSPMVTAPAIAQEISPSQQWSMNNSFTVMDGPSQMNANYNYPSASKARSKRNIGGETVSFVASPHSPSPAGTRPQMGPIIGTPQAGAQPLHAPSQSGQPNSIDMPPSS